MDYGAPIGSSEKPKPHVHVSYDNVHGKDGGDIPAVTLGQVVMLQITGTLTGFRMDEYGCSVDLEPTSIEIGAGPVDEKRSMVKLVSTLRKRGG